MSYQDLNLVYARAVAANPGVQVSRDDFSRHCLGLIESGRQAPELGGIRAQELYLALACGQNDRVALNRFEDELMPTAARAMRDIGKSPEFVDEGKQLLRQRLFLPSTRGARPKILDYAGQGALGAWLRIVAIRVALDLRRHKLRDLPVDTTDLAAVEDPQVDPELDLLRERYVAEFDEAFRAACEGLERRQRAVLRLKILEGLNIEEIGKIYRVHRATVARWLVKAQQDLVTATKQYLVNKLNTSVEELDSLIRLIREDLEVSLTSYLLTPNPDDLDKNAHDDSAAVVPAMPVEINSVVTP